MQTERQPESVDYARAIAALVAELSLERAAQVYDFVRFLQSQSGSFQLPAVDDDGWLDDSEERMQAEDEQWAKTYARRENEFATMIAEAKAEIEAGVTEPLFSEDGDLLLP